jgi:hypothetical protein
MKQLIENIINKDFDTANKTLEEGFKVILEKKMYEMKKMYAAKMGEQNTHAERMRRLKMDVIEEDEVDEGLLQVAKQKLKLLSPTARANMKKPVMRNIAGKPMGQKLKIAPKKLEEEHSFVLKDKKTKEVVGTYKTMEDAASARTKKGGTKETHGIYKQRHAGALKNRMSEEASEESSMARSELQAITKDAKIIMSKIKGNKELEAWTQSKITKAADYMNAVADYMEGDKEETLEESRVNIVNLRVRGGKIQRRQKVSGVPGMTFRGGKLERMSAAERRRRKLGAMKAARKSKAKKSQTLRKRKMSLMKRQRLGL